jgi:hypothetical protein
MKEILLKIKENCKNHPDCDGCQFQVVNRDDILWGCILLQDPFDWPIDLIIEAYENIDEDQNAN